MSKIPHTAMLLAGGLGTRLRPLTTTIPKPLIEIGGKALIDRMLDPLVAAGTTRAIVNVHWLADQIEAHLAKRKDIEIVISDEREELLETGGGLAKARPLMGDDPIFVLNTDAFWAPESARPLTNLAEAFDPGAMDAFLLLANTRDTLGFDGAGDFFLSDEGTLSRRGDAASAPWAFAGARIIQPQLYDDVPAEPFSANLIWNDLIPKGRLHGLPMTEFWLHVGDPAALTEANAWLEAAESAETK